MGAMVDPILSLPEILEGDPLGYLRANNRALVEDALIRGSVAANNLSAPPGGASRGVMWILSGAGTGHWAGRAAGDIAIALVTDPASSAGWHFFTPTQGFRVRVLAGSPTGLLEFNGSAWVAIHALQLASPWDVASLSATTTVKLGVAPRAGTVKRLVILCETASTSSSGNEWQFSLLKRTVASPGSTVAMFTTTVGTFTSLSGVGGGAEFVAHKAYVLTPNQNASVGDLDVLELTMTKVGTATTLANVRAFVELAA